ncbi:MAG: protein kinase [Deltaproteobacteria bacterium]|nr:protein kinase [Deltaproteobacteria bacterium]
MLATGTMIDGKYRVVRLLGQGGMGEVYEAEHAFLQRRLAIKILNPEYTRSEDAVKRFYREAQAAGRVGHENICEVFDVGTTVGGLPYIVMQLLQGESLTKRIAASAPLPVSRVIDISEQALAALHAAHTVGIVHRDMKPDNVFLTRIGGRPDFVKIVDFGISKIRFLDAGGNVTVTRTGTVLGTPLYMSPEQARGESDVDARADVWSMGVIMYEMLLGHPPFKGDNYNQVLYSVLSAPIVSVRSQREGVSRELDRVVMQALDRDPGRRPATAEKLREDLLAAWLTVAESGFSFPASGSSIAPGLGDGDTEIGSYRALADPSQAGGATASPAGPAAAAVVPVIASTPTAPAIAETLPAPTPTQEKRQLEGELDKLLRKAVQPALAAEAVVRPAATPAASVPPEKDSTPVAPGAGAAKAAAAGLHAERVEVAPGRAIFVVTPERRDGPVATAKVSPKVENTPPAVLAGKDSGATDTRTSRRRRFPVAFAAVVLLSVAATVAVVLIGRTETPTPRSQETSTAGSRLDASLAGAPSPGSVGSTTPTVASAVPTPAGAVGATAPRTGTTLEVATGVEASFHLPSASGADAGTVPESSLAVADAGTAPELLPDEAGRLSISGAQGVEVLFDGSPIGFIPLGSISVPPGTHTLTFRSDRFGVRREEPVEIVPGEETTVRRTLAELGGRSPSTERPAHDARAGADATGAPSPPAVADAGQPTDGPRVRIRTTYGGP